jgi:hypothetical protein
MDGGSSAWVVYVVRGRNVHWMSAASSTCPAGSSSNTFSASLLVQTLATCPAPTWAHAQALPLEQAIAEGLEEDMAVESEPEAPRATPPST